MAQVKNTSITEIF